MSRHFVMATAGHVDHGKSALVRALTEVDPDRLPEEKSRGITIDLGFAELSLPSEKYSGQDIRLGIIDVPGHEDFVRNMVAGVGCVSLGLVVVAADDGWMPQTEEHLQILEYLGVERIVVVLNKIDLAPDDEAFLKEVILDELQNSRYAGAPIMATSTTTGLGIDGLKQLLVEQFDQVALPADVGKPRLSVDRAFSVKGHGTVVTGSLIDGALTANQAVVIQPGGEESRVRSLQNFGQEIDAVAPGARVAINLAGVGVRKSGEHGTGGVGRGDVVTVPSVAVSTRVLDTVLIKSARLSGKSEPAAKPLKHGARIRLHHGSSNVPGRVFFLTDEGLAPGGKNAAELRLEGDVMLLTGDRFVLRDWSEKHTLAGGWVVEAEADDRQFRSSGQKKFLAACVHGEPSCETLLKAIVDRDQLLPEIAILQRSTFGPGEISDLMGRLEAEGQLACHEGWVFKPGFWTQQIGEAKVLIDRWHQEHCELLGIPTSQLRSQLDRAWSGNDGFVVLVKALENDGYILENAMIRRADHQISLPRELEGNVVRIRKALGEKSLEPPSRKQVLGSDADDRAIRFLLTTGEILEISEELVFLKSGYEELVRLVTEFLTKHGSGTVSDLRQHTGVSRRIILPVLERLDATGVTAREGDMRRLKA